VGPPLLVTAPIVALFVAVTGAATPVRVPFGNGYGTAWIATPSGRLEGLSTRVYAERTPNDPSVDIASESFAGVAIDGGPGVWLRDQDAEAIGFEPGTGIVAVRHHVGPVRVDEYWFSPWGLARPAVVLVTRVTNEDTQNAHSLTLAALLRYSLGAGAPEATDAAEHVTLVGPSEFQESGTHSAHRLVYRALPTANQVALTPSDPFADFATLGRLTGGASGGDVSDPVSGDALEAAFARGPVQLAPGAQAWFTIVAAYGDQTEASRIGPAIADWVDGRSSGTILEDERAAWALWASRDGIGQRVAAQGNVLLTEPEQALWSHALVTLRMSQVREPNAGLERPSGQIVASLLPGPRQRTYPRDLAYAVVALAWAGYSDEAWDALSFVLQGHGGRLSESLGADYAVSVSRYFGDGTEDTRAHNSATTASVGFDGMGLYLWALGAWADRQPSLARVEPYWPLIRDRIAGALEAVVVPETGLVRADAGIWEHAGPERHHASTTIAAVAGLCAATRIATRLGDAEAAARFADGARAMRAALLARMVDPASGALVGNLEEQAEGTARDASVVEAINWGLVPADSALARATLDGVGLLALGPGLGLARTDDPSDADRESVLADLRAAAALSVTGRQFEADALVARVVAQAHKRARGMVPELLDPWGGPAGGVPMAGMGGAALALARLRGQEVMDADGCLAWVPEPEPTPDEPPDAGAVPDVLDASADEPPKGPVLGPPRVPPKGGCGGGDGGGIGWLFALLTFAAVGSRRRRLT
jgi:GH15 family glucan-1,4-alpha-glucosidase